jgi:DNA-binding response OmpR family regulator
LRSRGATIPAVAVPAFARSEDRILALQAGYNMHISKPLEPMELIAVIAALVPQRSSKGRPFGHSH